MRRPDRRTQYSESEGALPFRVQLRRKDRIAIVDEELIGMIARNGVPQLLERPFRRRMSRHITMQNRAAADLHGYEHEQNPETRGHGTPLLLSFSCTEVVPNFGDATG